MNKIIQMSSIPESREFLEESLPLEQLCQLAEIVSKPATHFHPDHTQIVLGSFGIKQFGRLRNMTEVERYVNLEVAEQIGISSLQFKFSTMNAPLVKDILGLIAAPNDAIENFLRHAASVRLQKSIRSYILKSDKDRIGSVLGDDACNTAMREAPFFYTDIVASSDDDEIIAVSEIEVLAMSLGAIVTYSYIEAIDNGLAQLFKWRLPNTFFANNVQDCRVNIQAFSRLIATKGPLAKAISKK